MCTANITADDKMNKNAEIKMSLKDNSPDLLPKEALDAADGNVEYLKSISLSHRCAA